jgi:hypothetical protein
VITVGTPSPVDEVVEGPGDSDPSPAAGPFQRTRPVVVAALAIGLLAARAPFAITSLWAEDGRIFMNDAIHRGAVASLFRSYQGYFHTVPRLIGALAAAVPLETSAVVVWGVVAAIVGWCAASISLASADWIENGWLRTAAALSIVALPSLQLESLANAANLQFTLLFASVIVLIDRAGSRRRRVNTIVLVTVTALSSALSVILIPVLLVRWWTTRQWRPDVVTSACGAAIGVQLLGVAIVHGSRTLNFGTTASNAVVRFGVEARTSFTLEAGPPVVRVVQPLVLVALVAVITPRAWAVVRRGRDQASGLAIVGVASVGFALWMFCALTDGAADRYAVLPMACLTWSLLLACDRSLAHSERWSHSTTTARLAPALLIVVALGWSGSWTPSDYRRATPSWSAGLAQAAQRCETSGRQVVRVVTAPGMTGPAPWYVDVPCRRLST